MLKTYFGDQEPLLVVSKLEVNLTRLITSDFIFNNLKSGSELSSNGLEFMHSYL